MYGIRGPRGWAFASRKSYFQSDIEAGTKGPVAW